MHKALPLVWVISFLLPISAAFAGIFSWTDREGNTHIADDISKVPAEYQTQAKDRQIEDNDSAESVQNVRKEEQPSAPKYKKKAAKYGQSGTEDTDKYGRGKAYWQNRAESLRESIEDLQQDYETLRSQERQCEQKPYNYLGKKPDCAIYRANKERVEKNIERTRQRLEVDLPDEARTAGASPGWLRY